MLRVVTSVGTMYIASTLRRTTTVTDHSCCTGFSCSAYNIDENAYPRDHTKQCYRNCDQPEIKGECVNDVLRRNEIPLIWLRDGALEVVSSTSVEEYVAISHVWKDGLGNPKANCNACLSAPSYSKSNRRFIREGITKLDISGSIPSAFR
jgi:hypothetical protein